MGVLFLGVRIPTTSYHFCLGASMQRRPDFVYTPVSIFPIAIDSAAAASQNSVSKVLTDLQHPEHSQSTIRALAEHSQSTHKEHTKH